MVCRSTQLGSRISGQAISCRLIARGVPIRRYSRQRPVAARPQARGQGARPQGPRALSRLRCTRSRRRTYKVGEVSRLIPRRVAETERVDGEPLTAPGSTGSACRDAIFGSEVRLAIKSPPGPGGAGPEGCSSDPFRFQKCFTKPLLVKAFARFVGLSLNRSGGRSS
jgi:hypothetical protein